MLKLKVQMQPATRRKAGEVTLKFITAEEIETDKFAEIDSWRDANGWLLFKENEFDPADIPEDDAEIEGKSPSKVMYNSLYKLHMVSGGSRDTWPAYYKRQMRRMTETIWDKIEVKEGSDGRN